MIREKHFDAIIIGAGIAGLTCGYCLSHSGLKVMVVDRQPEPGGVIRSQRTDGYLLEFGPNTISTSRPQSIKLIAELGLHPHLQSRPLKDNAQYIWRHNRLSVVPGSFSEFIETDLLSFQEKLSAATRLFKQLPTVRDDIPVGQYFRPRLGEGIVNAMLKPAIAGMYAANADRVGLHATFPRLAEAARCHTRLISILKSLRNKEAESRSPRTLTSFDDGLQTLPHAIAAAIVEHDGEVILSRSSRIEAHPGNKIHRWNVHLSDGRTGVTDHIIIAAGATAAADLLEPHSQAAAHAFKSIEYAPLTIVHAGAKEEQFQVQRNGLGILVTRDNGVRALSILWNDRLFTHRAPRGHRLLTTFYGGELDPGISDLTNDQLLDQVRQDLTRTMGFHGTLDFHHITRWKSAIPLFRVGHRELIKKAIATLPAGLYPLGNHTGDPSIPGRIEAAINFSQNLTKTCATNTVGSFSI